MTATRPPGPAPAEDLARGAVLTLAGSVITALATLAFTVLITRGASQDQAGIFFALSGMFLICAAVCRLAVPVGLVYFLVRYRARDAPHLIRPLVRHASLVVVGLATAVGVVGVVMAAELAEVLVGTRESTAVALVRVLSCCLVFAALGDVGIGATRGLGALRPLLLVDRIARPITQLLGAVVVLSIGTSSALGFGLAWALPWVPAAFVVIGWLYWLQQRVETTPARTSSHRLEAGQSAEFWRFTAPRTVGSIAQLALQRSDIVLIGALRGPRDAAVYTAATRFLVFGQLASNAVNTSIQPRLAQLLALDDRTSAAAVYRIATVWLVLLAWPIYLTSAIFARHLLGVFGSGYEVGANVILVLSLVMLVATACGPVDVVLSMAGRTSWTMGNSLAALAVNVALNLALIPRLGILGAALAWAAAIAVSNLLPLAQLALLLRLHPFGRSTAHAALLTLLCFGGLPLAVRPVLGDGLPAALLTAVGATLVYAVLVWRWWDRLELSTLGAVRRARRPAG